MKKILLLLVAVIIVAPAVAQAKKTTYIVTDKRLNYVKLVEAKKAEVDERGITHPATISEQKMRDILNSIMLSKQHLFGEDVDTRQVFDQRAVDYLAPALSRAFEQAKPNEEVQFSYIVKAPLIILRNDRLTMVTSWVSDNNLYLEFQKLYAKIQGDTDKRGNYSKIISGAKGVRISLELKPGQQMAAVGSDTMVVDLNYNFTPASSAAKAATASASSESKDSSAAATEEAAKPKKSKYSRNKKSSDVGSDEATSAASASAAPAQKTTEQRLEELDMLRKRNLISKKDYDEKKKEILKDL